MDSRIIKTYEDFLQLEEDWKRLESQDPDGRIYNHFSFTKNWLNSYLEEEDFSPYIIQILREDKTLALAPFYLKKRKKLFLEWSEIHFLTQGDYHNILVDQEGQVKVQNIIREIFATLEKNQEDWDRLVLDYIDVTSELAYYLLRSEKYNPSFALQTEIPYLNFEEYENLQDLRQVIPNFNKKRNKFKREVGYTFVAEEDITEEIFDEVANLHKKQQEYLREEQNRKSRYSLYEDEKRDRYIRSLAKEGPLKIFSLKSAEGKILSYLYTFLDGETYYSWNTAYDVKYKDYSPTTILRYEVYLYLLENKPQASFDLGAGRYPWKFQWARKFNSLYLLDYWGNRASPAYKLQKKRGH